MLRKYAARFRDYSAVRTAIYLLCDRPASIREVISLALIVAMLALSVPAAARGRWSAVGRCWFTRNEGAGSEARRPTAKFGKRC